jgi:phosphatidylinositol-4,5-bisphosphate 3-kinase
MDPKVRAYAAHCLEELPDEDLSLYMLQLVQQLKFENHIDSALSRLLLRRSLRNRRVIGHIFFWFLQSEVYNLDVRSRFIALLQIYLRNCGHHRIELGHQMFVMKRLEVIAQKVVDGDSKAARLEILRQQLRDAILPPEFQLPLNPLMKVRLLM